MKRLDVMYFSSCGGHLVQLLIIAKKVNVPNCKFVVNDRVDVDAIMKGRVLTITHARRSLLQLINILEVIGLLIYYRPKVILSTGAAPAVWFGFFKWLVGAKFIFVESFSRISEPSMTGLFCQFLADDLFVQWPDVQKKLRGSKYFGGVI